ncbi:MAG TPA: RsmD family RNA methyltransferase [Tepidisphaeraceae bacterium]|jgi:16S rRNA (guanine966-N2)-methyltransferase
MRKLCAVRIISGEHRGRVLVPPPGDATRPITDRAKQSIFDVLNPLIDGAVVYDCFCGTGSMGLECLSRGARLATFFDADRGALAGLRKNIAALRVEKQSTVLSGDIFKVAGTMAVPSLADLIFVDPPYRFLVEQPQHLRSLATMLIQRHAAAGALFIFRHDTADSLSLPGLDRADVRIYGSMTIELLRAAPAGSLSQGQP